MLIREIMKDKMFLNVNYIMRNKYGKKTECSSHLETFTVK